MIDATEPALRLRSQFVAEPLHRRDGVSHYQMTGKEIIAGQPHRW
jgi:hypothetical protein